MTPAHAALNTFCDAQALRLRASLSRYVSRSAKVSQPVVATSQEPWHGTMTGYTQHRCRCGLCVERNCERQRRRTTSGTCHECRNPAMVGRSRCAKCLEKQRNRRRAKAPERTLSFFRQKGQAA